MPLPPGSTAHPFRQLVQWLRDPLDYMQTSSEQFGSLFTFCIGGQGPMVMISDPADLQTLFTHAAVTAPGEKNEMARPLLGDNSVILLSGEQHRQRRKLVMPHFQGERMVSYTNIIRQTTEQIIGNLEPQQTFNVRNAMQDITLRVILQAVFGLTSGERLENLRQGIIERLGMTSKGFKSTLIFLPFLRQDWGPWSPWGQVMQKQRECDAMIYGEIRDRRANPDPERVDILNLLLSARDEAGEPLTDVELRDELMTLLFAGHETTATALTWALYWLHKFPEIREKVIQELVELGPGAKPMEVFKLPYLTAVCNETLRIYPVGMLTFTRVLSSPVEMGGYTLDPGTSVVGSIYLTHQREDLYPQAQDFRPERFLERQYSPYEFLPFGGGARRCLGMALAQFEMKWVLATILQTFQLSLMSQQPLKAIRRATLLGPENDFTMRFMGKRSRLKDESCLQSSKN